jgi:hypothetical protein
MRKAVFSLHLNTATINASKASKCKRKNSQLLLLNSKLQDLAVIVQTGTQGEILAALAFKADGILSEGLAAGSCKAQAVAQGEAPQLKISRREQ